MRSEDDHLAAALSAAPVPAFPRHLSERTRALAHAHLGPLPAAATTVQLQLLPAQAMCAAMLSADAVFAADACLKIGRLFGG